VHDAALAGAHRVERDDLALADGLLAELHRDGGEALLATRAIALDVEDDVATALRPAVDDPVREELEREQRGAALADEDRCVASTFTPILAITSRTNDTARSALPSSGAGPASSRTSGASSSNPADPLCSSTTLILPIDRSSLDSRREN